jgi:hypothetical protein
MRFIVCSVAVGLIALLVSCAGSTVTPLTDSGRLASASAFGASWNTHAATCNFDTNAGVVSTTTLGDMYNGSDFSGDITLMNVLISTDLGEPSGLSGAEFGALYLWYDNTGDGDDIN